MEMVEIKQNTYSDLRSSYELWNAWKADFTFPIANVSDSFLSKLHIEELEYIVKKEKDIYTNYSRLISDLEEMLKLAKHSLLFTFGHDIAAKSKLRSYKGLLSDKKASLGEFSEFEFEFDGKRSILGAWINLKGLENEILDDLFFNLPNNYIINSNGGPLNNFDENKLMDKTLFKQGEQCYINFYETLEFWFSKSFHDMEIIRLGGNGNTDISIQKFGYSTLQLRSNCIAASK